MINWLNNSIEKAGWLRFILWLAVNIGYSVWAFLSPGPWRNIAAATGDGAGNDLAQVPKIPEVMPGFPAGEPAASFSKMSEVIDQYILFQAIDIPYAIISMMMAIAAISIGLKRFNLSGGVKFVLFLPIIYFASELVENALLAAMAGEYIPDDSVFVLLQQSATTTKFVTDGLTSVAMAISIITAIGAAFFSLFKRKKTSA
ncbi:MAG: hypothetical protein DHS20C05_04210 [Hyphococcus sp.]|nr:MAG: hypothetical protein DHS20C05_04210 [Marinicaulis sp.]